MTPVQQNLTELRTTIPADVTLVAVSKFHPAEMIQEAYDIGQRIFGESKVQELLGKKEILPTDIKWHFIGHLQTNKVKFIAPFISLIHSIDSLRLLQEVNKCAAREQRVIDVLLQIHVAQEQTKFGFTPDECLALFSQHNIQEWTNIRICGIMGMASFTDNTTQIRQEFGILREVFERLKNETFAQEDYFKWRSYGMSDDYPIAIEEGSNMVRIGTHIFGVRNY
jgi:pyridoxal phosphate enzyme, YggS family